MKSYGLWFQLLLHHSFVSIMNKSSVALDDDQMRRNLPSICRPLAWECRRPYSANYTLDLEHADDMRTPRSRLYQYSHYVPSRSRDDLFYQRPPVDSSRLLEVAKAGVTKYRTAPSRAPHQNICLGFNWISRKRWIRPMGWTYEGAKRPVSHRSRPLVVRCARCSVSSHRANADRFAKLWPFCSEAGRVKIHERYTVRDN